MSRKIAIVEDDQAISQMYKIKFESDGYEVFIAENGIKGLKVIKKHKPDVILLDLMMPEMTGDDMLKKLRATDWGKDMKVIILTNVSKDEVSPVLQSLNISNFIVKAHYTPQEVVEVTKEVLGRSANNQ